MDRRSFPRCAVLLFVICGFYQAATARKPIMIPAAKEHIIQEGEELKIECQGEGKVQFSTQETIGKFSKSNFNILRDDSSSTYTFIMPTTTRVDTGWYACAEEGIALINDEGVIDHKSDDIAWIYVYVNSSEPFAIDANYDLMTAVVGGSLVVPCRPTSPDLPVTLEINWGMEEVPTGTTYDPKIGFVIEGIGQAMSALNYECQLLNKNEKTYTLWPTYISHVADPAPLEKPRINQDQIRHVVWEKDLIVDCTITTPIGYKLTLSWKVPESVPIERWSYNRDPKCVSKGNSLSTWETKLTVRNVSKADEGEYVCIAVYVSGRRESRTTIKIWDPSVTYINATVEGNASITLEEKQNVQWKIEIDTYPENFTLTWNKPDGQEIILNGPDKVSKYSYSRDGLWHYFKISKLHVDDNGNYTINLCTERDKKTVTLQLTVLAEPFVNIGEVSSFYLPGKTATFTCHTLGQPLPNVTWFVREYPDFPNKENPEIKNPSNVTTKQGHRGPYHLVSTLEVKINQSGDVICRSCNAIKCVSSTDQIFVSDVPESFGIIDPGLVTEGDNINVTCGASVYNFTDTITWRPEDLTKGELNTSRIRLTPRKTNFTTQSILEIRSVTKSNAGKYICEAESKEGHLEKKDFQLIVYGALAPRFKNNSTNNMINSTIYIDLRKEKETSKKFTCAIEGRPIPEVIWYKDDQPIVKSKRFMLLDNNSTLQIPYFLDGESGRYLCRANNRFGTAERYTDIKISGKSQSIVVWISSICALIAIIIVVITYMGIKVHRERKLRKELLEAGLTHFENGALECMNPELTVDDQAELLPYDKKWEFPRENLKLGKQLGSGAFGVVMKAEARGICVEGEVTTVAVKMVRRTAEPCYMKALSSELKIMIHLGRHLNVVNLLGACTKTILTKRELYVIVEYCRFGNLHNYLQRHRSSFIDQIDPVTQNIDSNIGMEHLVRSESVGSQNRLKYAALSFSRSISIRSSESNSSNELVDYRQGTEFRDINMSPDGGVLSNNSIQAGWRSNYRGDYKDQNLKPICTQDLLCWAWQVSRGMEYLSSRNVLHGDLAARNILLADDNIVKICDFGLAKNMYKDENYKKKGDSPLPIKWMAIESIRDRMFSTQSDVWSFGIVLWEFFTLARTPYPGMEAEKQYDKLIEGYRMEKPQYATDEIYDLMTHCWKAKPSLRPSFPELAEKFGTLLNDSIRTHYLDLNTPYMDMNTVAMQSGQSDYLTMMSSPNHDYDNAPDPTSLERPDSSYLSMSPLAKTCDSGIFSPRLELEESHFKFPPPAKNTPVNSDSEDCIDSEPKQSPAPEDPYMKPIDVKQRRAEFTKQSREPTPTERDSGYCNVTINPHHPNLTNQLSENIRNLHRTQNTDKFQKTNNKDLPPTIISGQDNYINMPKQKSDRLKDPVDSFSNPSYVIMSPLEGGRQFA